MIDDEPLSPRDANWQEQSRGASGTLPAGSFASMSKPPLEDQGLSATWRERFQAFDNYGRPGLMFKNGDLEGRSLLAYPVNAHTHYM